MLVLAMQFSKGGRADLEKTRRGISGRRRALRRDAEILLVAKAPLAHDDLCAAVQLEAARASRVRVVVVEDESDLWVAAQHVLVLQRVRPQAHRVVPYLVLAEREHPLLLSDPADVLARLPFHGHSLDVLAHHHDLMDRHPAAIPGVPARVAANRAVEPRDGPVGKEWDPRFLQGFGRRLVVLLAFLAQGSNEALRENAVDRGGDEEGFDPHLSEPCDGRRSVIRVKG